MFLMEVIRRVNIFFYYCFEEEKISSLMTSKFRKTAPITVKTKKYKTNFVK